jgi:hypothetical protein
LDLSDSSSKLSLFELSRYYIPLWGTILDILDCENCIVLKKFNGVNPAIREVILQCSVNDG